MGLARDGTGKIAPESLLNRLSLRLKKVKRERKGRNTCAWILEVCGATRDALLARAHK